MNIPVLAILWSLVACAPLSYAAIDEASAALSSSVSTEAPPHQGLDLDVEIDPSMLEALDQLTYRSLQVAEVALGLWIDLFEAGQVAGQWNGGLLQRGGEAVAEDYEWATEQGFKVAVVSTEVVAALFAYVAFLNVGELTIDQFVGANPYYSERVALRAEARRQKKLGAMGAVPQQERALVVTINSQQLELDDVERSLRARQASIASTEAALRERSLPAGTRRELEQSLARLRREAESFAWRAQALDEKLRVSNMELARLQLPMATYQKRLGELNDAFRGSVVIEKAKTVVRRTLKVVGLLSVQTVLLTTGGGATIVVFDPDSIAETISGLKLRHGALQRLLDDHPLSQL